MAGPSDELRAMYRRATAARDLAARGEVDGEVALSYVIWPTPTMEVPDDERSQQPDARKEAARPTGREVSTRDRQPPDTGLPGAF